MRVPGIVIRLLRHRPIAPCSERQATAAPRCCHSPAALTAPTCVVVHHQRIVIADAQRIGGRSKLLVGGQHVGQGGGGVGDALHICGRLGTAGATGARKWVDGGRQLRACGGSSFCWPVDPVARLQTRRPLGSSSRWVLNNSFHNASPKNSAPGMRSARCSPTASLPALGRYLHGTAGRRRSLCCSLCFSPVVAASKSCSGGIAVHICEQRRVCLTRWHSKL